MKKVYTLLVALLLTATLWAQSPEKINYQAVIRDANSTLLTNQAVGMQISILQGSASGTAVYVETQSPTTNANGLVTVEIGNGTSSDDFSAIDWSVDSYFIKTETDPTGGSDYTITGTSQLLSIPYALYAKIAENYNETDPLFSASPFIALTQEDVDNWAGELDELDPVFSASFANTISEANTTYWNNKLDEFTELDSVFLLSLANAISKTDTTYWNSKLDEFTETDPIFLAHPSSSITEDNIEEWKDVWTRYTDNEDDYLAQNSPAGDILLDDITFWNSRPVVYTESDPVFTNSLAFSITQEDSTNLANLLGINTGDQAMDDYATKANFSDDSIKVLTDSIDGFRIALIDSAYDFHIVLDDSIVNFRSALIDSAYDNFHLALKDSMADFREEVSDSINDFRIALRDSMASFRENDLTDSTKQIRKAFNDSITQIFTPALNDSIADLRDEIPVTVGLSIGDEYGGGIIFWLDDSGIHGLIAATSDLPGKVSWGDNTITTDATADGVYAGMSNTDSIIAKQGAADYAVDRCANYSVTTLTTPPEYYDDWYLPSKHELSLLYVQKDVVGGFIVNADISYWTSTEHDVGNAWEQVFRTGTQQTYGKWYTGGNRTRAIRAF